MVRHVLCVEQIKLILSGHTGREGKHKGCCLTHKQHHEPASPGDLGQWLRSAATAHDFFCRSHFWWVVRSPTVFLSWAVTCSWDPTVVSVFLPGGGVIYCQLLRDSDPFPAASPVDSLLDAHLHHLIRKHSGPLWMRSAPLRLTNSWHLGPCPQPTLPVPQKMAWSDILLILGTQVPREKQLMPWPQQSGVSVLSVMIY